MELELTLSQQAARWLEARARVTGTDEAAVAAGVLEELAEQQLGCNGSTPDDRLRFLREWVAGLPTRPGPAVDATRDGIYD